MRIGIQELLVILLIAAVVFGGGKLAGVGKALGKSVLQKLSIKKRLILQHKAF